MDDPDICLACPHRQCAHDPGGPPLAQCPAQRVGHSQRATIAIPKKWVKEQQKF